MHLVGLFIWNPVKCLAGGGAACDRHLCKDSFLRYAISALQTKQSNLLSSVPRLPKDSLVDAVARNSARLTADGTSLQMYSVPQYAGFSKAFFTFKCHAQVSWLQLRPNEKYGFHYVHFHETYESSTAQHLMHQISPKAGGKWQVRTETSLRPDANWIAPIFTKSGLSRRFLYRTALPNCTEIQQRLVAGTRLWTDGRTDVAFIYGDILYVAKNAWKLELWPSKYVVLSLPAARTHARTHVCGFGTSVFGASKRQPETVKTWQP